MSNTSPTALLLNVGHAMDHLFLLIFATAVSAIAAEWGMVWQDLMPYTVGAFVLFGLGSLPAAVALGGGAALIVLMIVAIGLLRNTVGVVLGWIVQVVIVAAGLLVPAFFIVGAIFTAMWAYCMIAAARIDRNNRAAAAAADNGTENP